MDPSYNNNLGGFGSGGTVPPAPAPAPTAPQPQFQPQQTIMSPQQPASISSGTGDIILSSAPEKKSSHKGIIIALILGVLAVVGVFAVMFLMPRGGSNSASGNAKQAFNRYANYLLYGKDSDKALEREYNEDENYKFYEIRSETSQAIDEYLDKANNLLNNFIKIAGNSTDILKTTVDDYRANFELVRLTLNKKYVSEEEIVSKVLENKSLETVDSWIENKYEPLVNSSLDIVKRYAEEEVKYYKLYAEFMQKAMNTGCLDENAGIVCDGFYDEDLELQMRDAYSAAKKYLVNSENAVMKDCWNIEKILVGDNT